MSDKNDSRLVLYNRDLEIKKTTEENWKLLRFNMRKKHSYTCLLKSLDHVTTIDEFERLIQLLSADFPSQMTSSTQVPDPVNCWVDRIHMHYIMYPWSVPILMKQFYSTFKITDFLAMWYFYLSDDAPPANHMYWYVHGNFFNHLTHFVFRCTYLSTEPGLLGHFTPLPINEKERMIQICMPILGWVAQKHLQRINFLSLICYLADFLMRSPSNGSTIFYLVCVFIFLLIFLTFNFFFQT